MAFVWRTPPVGHEERERRPTMTQSTDTGSPARSVEIPSGSRRVRGILGLPAEPVAAIVFAHGSGSGQFSPRNQFVAEVLRAAGLATLLIDLLEADEGRDQRNVFDIELLADRLGAASRWLRRDPETRGLRLGYCGSGIGAAAAAVAAARQPEGVGAVVTRGGRPDLAWDALPDVVVPTLLIVGSRDEDVRELNRQALALLRCPKELVVIPGATHLFEEPGALEEVARLARQWFLRHLGPDPRARSDPSQTGPVGPIPARRDRR
jgi:putative phosphoribosyl transferase